MSHAISERTRVSDRYLELIREFPLRPIRTKADYRRAGKAVDRLAVQAEGSLSADEQDYLATLSLLIEDYDRKRRAAIIGPAEPIGLLRHLIEANDMSVTDLGDLLGSKSVASEVLRGKRALSKANVLKLASRFKVDAGVFLSARRETGRAVAKSARA